MAVKVEVEVEETEGVEEAEEVEVSCGAPLLPGLSPCHTVTQPTR